MTNYSKSEEGMQVFPNGILFALSRAWGLLEDPQNEDLYKKILKDQSEMRALVRRFDKEYELDNEAFDKYTGVYLTYLIPYLLDREWQATAYFDDDEKAVVVWDDDRMMLDLVFTNVKELDFKTVVDLKEYVFILEPMGEGWGQA